MSVDRLKSCAELTAEDAERAASSSASLKELIGWASRVAKPNTGAPKLLMAVAKAAVAEWFEGTPTVEIGGSNAHTTIAVYTDHGGGIRERVVPFTRFDVPVEEFARMIRLYPKIIAPLKSAQRAGMLILELEQLGEDDETSGVPSGPAARAIRIDPSSLGADPAPAPAAAKPAPDAKGAAATAADTVRFAPGSLQAALEEKRRAAALAAGKAPPPSPDEKAEPAAPKQSGPRPAFDPSVHTRQTVRRMVAVRPEALRSGNDDE